MDAVHRSWWKVWEQESIASYIPRPNKWLKTTRVPEVDDIVIFLDKDKETALGKTLWKLGRVLEVVNSKDEGKRMVNIGYKNPSEWHKSPKEAPWRDTWRSTRKIAILHREEDLELIEELNKAAKEATVSMFVRIENGWSCKAAFCTRDCIDSARHSSDVDIYEE